MWEFNYYKLRISADDIEKKNQVADETCSDTMKYLSNDNDLIISYKIEHTNQ